MKEKKSLSKDFLSKEINVVSTAFEEDEIIPISWHPDILNRKEQVIIEKKENGILKCAKKAI